jgi:hypothetical protein
MGEMNEALNRTYVMKTGETTLGQYCVSVLDTATEGQCTRPAGANAGNIAGVLADTEHVAGKEACYCIAGVTKVKISAAVAIGDVLVISGADGRVAPKGAGAHASGIGIVGRALSAANSANSFVRCHLGIPNEYSS